MLWELNWSNAANQKCIYVSAEALFCYETISLYNPGCLEFSVNCRLSLDLQPSCFTVLSTGEYNSMPPHLSLFLPERLQGFYVPITL